MEYLAYCVHCYYTSWYHCVHLGVLCALLSHQLGPLHHCVHLGVLCALLSYQLGCHNVYLGLHVSSLWSTRHIVCTAMTPVGTTVCTLEYCVLCYHTSWGATMCTLDSMSLAYGVLGILCALLSHQLVPLHNSVYLGSLYASNLLYALLSH